MQVCPIEELQYRVEVVQIPQAVDEQILDLVTRPVKPHKDVSLVRLAAELFSERRFSDASSAFEKKRIVGCKGLLPLQHGLVDFPLILNGFHVCALLSAVVFHDCAPCAATLFHICDKARVPVKARLRHRRLPAKDDGGQMPVPDGTRAADLVASAAQGFSESFQNRYQSHPSRIMRPSVKTIVTSVNIAYRRRIASFVWLHLSGLHEGTSPSP